MLLNLVGLQISPCLQTPKLSLHSLMHTKDPMPSLEYQDETLDVLLYRCFQK